MVKAKQDDDGDELDFELVTSARMLAPAPSLRHEKVILKEWLTTSGKPACFLVWEQTAADYAEFLESGRVYKDGVLRRYDTKDEDFRFLSYVIRDSHNNRLWHSFEAAKLQLGAIGKSSLGVLMAAANRVNNERPGSAEGNSETTPSDS